MTAIHAPKNAYVVVWKPLCGAKKGQIGKTLYTCKVCIKIKKRQTSKANRTGHHPIKSDTLQGSLDRLFGKETEMQRRERNANRSNERY